MTTAFGSMAVGAWLWGELAALRSPSIALAASGVLMMLALALRHRYRMPEPQPVDWTPARAAPEPKAALEFDRANVPVLIRVEYLVPPAQGDEFALAMRGLRQVRRRDGAVRWRLWHDIDRPDRWVETYQHASWIEHLRHRGPAQQRQENLLLHVAQVGDVFVDGPFVLGRAIVVLLGGERAHSPGDIVGRLAQPPGEFDAIG